jgi:hypothetical protein
VKTGISWSLPDTAAVVRDRGIVGAGQVDDRGEVRLPRS